VAAFFFGWLLSVFTPRKPNLPERIGPEIKNIVERVVIGAPLIAVASLSWRCWNVR